MSFSIAELLGIVKPSTINHGKIKEIINSTDPIKPRINKESANVAKIFRKTIGKLFNNHTSEIYHAGGNKTQLITILVRNWVYHKLFYCSNKLIPSAFVASW